MELSHSTLNIWSVKVSPKTNLSFGGSFDLVSGCVILTLEASKGADLTFLEAVLIADRNTGSKHRNRSLSFTLIVIAGRG